MAGRWRWLWVILGIWAAWWIIGGLWSGEDLASSTLRSYVLGEQTQFVSDGKLAASLGNPDAKTLKLLAAGVGLAPSTPTVRVRPTITYEATNADIALRVSQKPVAARRIRVTMELTRDGWKVAGMDILP